MPLVHSRRFFRIVSRAVCIGLLALPFLTAPTAEAAAKHRKAHAKSVHGIKKHKTPAAGKQVKGKKIKTHAKKPAAPKKHAANAGRTLAKAGSRIAAKTHAPPARMSLEKPAGTPLPAEAVEAPSEPRHATQVCRRQGRIYLLADCAAPLPAVLAAAPATAAVR